jgi:formylglycine-generating enzyme required for sulfatase activity
MQKSRLYLWLSGFCVALTAVAAWQFKPADTKEIVATGKLQCDLPAPDAKAPHPGMVWVPPGNFDMGDSVYAEEKPVRNVQVKGFWMDRTEVTNQEFAAFVKATGYVTVAERPVDPKLHASLPEVMRQAGAVVFKMPSQLTRGDDPSQWWQYLPGANWQHPAGPATNLEMHGHFPVVHITYEDALAYAKWKGRTLPTEAQWEWAARAGAKELPSQHDQPASANTWQGIFPMANSAEDGFAGLAPVGCYGANAWGLFDMIGNVWELTADVFVAERSAPSNGQGLDPDAAQKPPVFKAGTPQARVIKGGSFLCAPNYCMRYRAGSRQPQEEDLAVSHLGFRTILQH